MKNIFKTIGIGILGVVVFTAFLGFSTPTANAEVNTNFWTRIAGNIIKTNPSVLKLQVPGTPGGAGCLEIDVSGNITSIGSACGSSSGNMAIGNPVGGGTPNEILYTDSNGDLGSDANFIRDETNNYQTIITATDGAGNNGIASIAAGILNFTGTDTVTGLGRLQLSGSTGRLLYQDAASNNVAEHSATGTASTLSFLDGTTGYSGTAQATGSGYTDLFTDGSRISAYTNLALDKAELVFSDTNAPAFEGIFGVYKSGSTPAQTKRVIIDEATNSLQAYHDNLVDIESGGSYILLDSPSNYFQIGAGTATQSTITGNSTNLIPVFVDNSGSVARTIYDATNTITEYDSGTGITSRLTEDINQIDLRWASGAGREAYFQYDEGNTSLWARLNDPTGFTENRLQITPNFAQIRFDNTNPATPTGIISAEDTSSYLTWNDGMGIVGTITANSLGTVTEWTDGVDIDVSTNLTFEKGTLEWHDVGNSIDGIFGFDNSGVAPTFNRGLVVDLANANTTLKEPATFNLTTPSVVMSGKVTTYNNIATVSNGIPAERATVDLTGQSAAIGATTIYAVPASNTGMYRVSWVASVTTAASVSSVLGGTNGFQVLYTDGDDAVVKTSPASVTSNANTTGTQISGSVIVYARQSTNIQYQMDYTSVGGTSMQYNLHVKVEAL